MTLALEHGLAESHTKMEAFITTCLWTSGLPSPQEIVAGSTLATLTQISSQFEQHLTEAGNTSERMGMWYTMTQEEDAGGVAKRSRDDVWADILSASTKDEFFEKGQELAPREFVTSFSSVQLFADWKYRPTREPYRNPRGLDCDISEFPSLEEWLRGSIQETTHTGRRYVDLVLGH